MGNKEKLSIYLDRETRAKIDQVYPADDCSSRTEFIEKAVNFYLGYRAADDSQSFLPKAVTAAIDGRLGLFEDRISALLFKQSVSQEMMMRVVAEFSGTSEVSIEKMRGQCVADVKRTNGRITFQDAVRCLTPEEN